MVGLGCLLFMCPCRAEPAWRAKQPSTVSNTPKGAPHPLTHMAVAQKTGTQNGTLVSGNMDQNLRNPSYLILSHTHIGSLCFDTQVLPWDTCAALRAERHADHGQRLLPEINTEANKGAPQKELPRNYVSCGEPRSSSLVQAFLFEELSQRIDLSSGPTVTSRACACFISISIQ